MVGRQVLKSVDRVGMAEGAVAADVACIGRRMCYVKINHLAKVFGVEVRA